MSEMIHIEYRTFNKNMSVDDMEKYYEDDNFFYLVVEV